MPKFCSSCGLALADQAAFCSACGTRVQVPEYSIVGEPVNSAKVEHPASHLGTLPSEIGRAHGKRGVLIGVVVTFAAILLVFAIWSSPPDRSATTSTVGQYESQQIGSYIPQPQKSFTSMIESFIPSFNNANTEVRKTNIRFERKDAIVQYFSRSGSLRFQGWVGEVQRLTTESDGKAHVSIKLKGSETVIENWNNSFSDSSSDTMISRSDALYPSLMDIKDGDEVTVSGTFTVEGGGQDYVREASVTEDGSMTSPEFIVRFNQISKGARASLPVLNSPALTLPEDVGRPSQALPVQAQAPADVPRYAQPVQDALSAQAPIEPPTPAEAVQVSSYAQPVEAPSVPAEAPRSDVLTVTVTKTKVVQRIDPQGHAMLFAKAYRKDAPDDRFSLICHTAKSSCTSLREGEDYDARILQAGDPYYTYDDLEGAVIVRIGNGVFALMREKKVREQ